MSSKVMNNKEKDEGDGREEGIGQGQLYSPKHAINLSGDEQGKRIKDKLLDKLAAATSKTTSSRTDPEQEEALEKAGKLIEMVMRDASLATHNIRMDALQRINSQLPNLFPSFSPSLTSKMVDDAEKECRAKETQQHHKRNTINVSPTSSKL